MSITVVGLQGSGSPAQGSSQKETRVSEPPPGWRLARGSVTLRAQHGRKRWVAPLSSDAHDNKSLFFRMEN